MIENYYLEYKSERLLKTFPRRQTNILHPVVVKETSVNLASKQKDHFFMK